MTRITPRALFRCVLWMTLISLGGCSNATLQKEAQSAKKVVCSICEKVASYCETGVPLTNAQKQEIVQELYPDAGAK